jgi:myo-inositol catabolism protein IolC
MEKELYILPFDHRNSFIKVILGVKDRKPTEVEINKAKELKMMIYEAFKKAVDEGIPKESAGILTDPWLGIDVLKKAKEEGFIFCIPVEKSGQDEFRFERIFWIPYIKKWNPFFVKALVRYNPEGDKELNRRQAARLAVLGRFLKRKGIKFMFELLVPPTESEKKAKDYENRLRPKLMVKAIDELHKAKVFPDVWKIEGLDSAEAMQKVADKVIESFPEAKIIILGRGESRAQAEKWLKAGAKVDAAIGFAVGRTVFQKPCEDYINNRISREKAVENIKEDYVHFVDIWRKARKIRSS